LQAPRVAPEAAGPSRELITANARSLLTKVGALPGVQNAALASSMPLEGQESFPFTIAGRPVAANTQQSADLEVVTPSYFSTFGAQLVRGRLLSDSDNASSPPVVMVSDSFVQRYLPGMNPLDERLMLGKVNLNGPLDPATPWQIVGVFHTVRNGEHLNDQSTPEIFAPFWQIPIPWMGLAVRTVFDPALISRDLRLTVAQTMPGYSLTNIQTMQDAIDSQLTNDRFGMVLFGLFAGLALLLAALGIYGVMAFAVAQRKHEIGLRMALGAQQSDVMRLILWDGMRLALIGVGIGLGGVYLLGRLLHSTLYGVNSVDVGSFAVVVVSLLGVAVLASYVPARRSAKIDPMIALRQD
jgi:putative ABC transport system permease protein